MTAYCCADCGWPWPLLGPPPPDAECDSCGGPLIPDPTSLTE